MHKELEKVYNGLTRSDIEAQYMLRNTRPKYEEKDIPLGVLIHKYFVLDIERPSLPGIEAWYGLLCEREAFQEHAMQPFGNSPEEFLELQRLGEQ